MAFKILPMLSFAALEYRDIGFDRGKVLIAAIDARHSAVPAAQRSALYERLRDETRALPGVENAAISLATPLGNAGVRFTPAIDVPGSRVSGVQQVLSVPASPGWFQTYGTRVIAGRDFDQRDVSGAREVAIVNGAFASRYFGNGGAVGRVLRRSGNLDGRSARQRVVVHAHRAQPPSAFRITNSRFAGRSASRRMYQGNQCEP